MYEQTNAGERIADLLIYRFSDNTENEITLDDYITNAQYSQESIHHSTGDDATVLGDSSFLDRYKEYKIHVQIFTDPVDEYIIQN